MQTLEARLQTVDMRKPVACKHAPKFLPQAIFVPGVTVLYSFCSEVQAVMNL